MLGPYGLTSGFGARAPRAATIRAGLWLRRLRVGQLLSDTAARLGPRPSANSRSLREDLAREPVEIDASLLPRVYRHFEDNLRAVIQAGHRAGARVAVNTVVSNLKDCAPFVPGRKPPLPQPQLARWEQLLQNAQEALAEGRPAQAVSWLTEAARLGGPQAELEYRLGRAT